MSEPQDKAVLRFFGGALLAIGWLSLTLGGLCTLIFGVMAVTEGRQYHFALEDWMLPAQMLLFGGACLWAGRAMRRSAARQAAQRPDE
jgi:uncharacterized membrane protein HdeD (DUF308 family)